MQKSNANVIYYHRINTIKNHHAKLNYMICDLIRVEIIKVRIKKNSGGNLNDHYLINCSGTITARLRYIMHILVNEIVSSHNKLIYYMNLYTYFIHSKITNGLFFLVIKITWLLKHR